MKRVRNFLILKIHDPNVYLDRRVPQELRESPDVKRIQGWHPSWDEAVLCVRDPSVHEAAIVDDNGSWNVIALFSRRKLELSEPDAKPKTKWKTSSIKGITERWCNLNYSDYGWDWVGGAEREVPFRLRYFERQAEANPDGLVSKTYAWLSEVLDMMRGPDKKIG